MISLTSGKLDLPGREKVGPHSSRHTYGGAGQLIPELGRLRAEKGKPGKGPGLSNGSQGSGCQILLVSSCARTWESLAWAEEEAVGHSG